MQDSRGESRFLIINLNHVDKHVKMPHALDDINELESNSNESICLRLCQEASNPTIYNKKERKTTRKYNSKIYNLFK